MKSVFALFILWCRYSAHVHISSLYNLNQKICCLVWSDLNPIIRPCMLGLFVTHHSRFGYTAIEVWHGRLITSHMNNRCNPLYISVLISVSKMNAACLLQNTTILVVRWMQHESRRLLNYPQIAKFMGPTWGSPGSYRSQMDPMLAPWTLSSRSVSVIDV